MTKPDITSRHEIEKLVDTFYEKIKADPLLSHIFKHVNWQRHLPIMYDFWSFTLLGEASYKSNLIQKHLHLAFQAEHFDQWLKLFNSTVDELFSGEKAEEAKSRAYSMAVVMQVKMGLS